MHKTRDKAGDTSDPSAAVVRELMAELGIAFDLSTVVGETTLGQAVERRIRSLRVLETPQWGTDGVPTQMATEESGALDFYYKPHLFPGMGEALRLGHHLQFDLLPRHLPEESPLRVAALLESYCHLSGDLLGWRLEGDELFFWIADVSGHGVRAGLAAATLYFLIDSIEPGLSPEAFAERVNEGMLAARNPGDSNALFATAVWIRAGSDGRIRYASAGHNPMLLLRSSGRIEQLESTGTPLGLFADQRFGQNQAQLGPDDALCLFTDGLVEATNPEGEEFGIRRVTELWQGRTESPMDLTRSIYRATRAHQDTRLFDDDLTLMVVDRPSPE